MPPQKATPCHPCLLSCYSVPWRDLRRRANAGCGSLNKPEITPPADSTTLATAPPEGEPVGGYLDVCVWIGHMHVRHHFPDPLGKRVGRTLSRTDLRLKSTPSEMDFPFQPRQAIGKQGVKVET